MGQKQKKAPSGSSPEARHCACFSLRRASRAITQLYDDFLRPSGLRTTQFSLLNVVQARGPVPINRLADGVIADRTTLTRNLKLLERKGWIRVAVGEDRRSREVSITPKGREAQRRAYPYWVKAQDFVMERLGEKRLDRLFRDLRTTVASLRDK